MRRIFATAFPPATTLATVSVAPSDRHPGPAAASPPTETAPDIFSDRFGALDRDLRPDRLPFGGIRTSASNRLPIHRPPVSKSTPASLVGGASSPSPRDSARSPASPQHPFSGADLKSKMMLQLLSSQAMIEASSFHILPFNGVEQLKKEQAKLETRLASISRKIGLEEKLRGATLTIIESGATDDESQVEQFTERLQQLRSDQHTIHSRLVDVRTQLLQHLSAVLSLSLTKIEQQQPSPSRASSLRPSQSPSSTLTFRRGSESPALTDLTAFDGPHLFANSTSDSLSTTAYFASQNLIDTGQLQGYEKKMADQMVELEELRAELVDLRAPSQRQESEQQSQAALELAKLRKEADSLANELERSRSNLGREQQILADRARDAEERARAAESRSRQLESDMDQLRLAVETAEEAKDSARMELVALQVACSRLAEQRTEMGQQRQQQVEALEREKARLAQDLKQLRNVPPQSPVSCPEWDALVKGIEQLGPLAGSALAQISARRPSGRSTVERIKWIQELVSGLEAHFTSFQDSQRPAAIKQNSRDNERTQLSSRVTENEAQPVDLQSSREDTSTRASSSLTQELKQLKQELSETASTSEAATKNLKSQLETAQKVTEASKLELITVRDELAAARKAQQDAGVVERTLRDLFRTLPPIRAKLEPEGDLSSFRAAYEATAEPVAKKSVLGGLFGLGTRAPTPALDESEYSLEAFVERTKGTVESDKRLIERLLKYEPEKEVYKANVLRATKLAEESREALKTYQQQVKELEERLEYADTQSATMLERFNDLMESEEKANGLARRAESATAPLQAQIKSLKEEAEGLRKELSDAEEEAERVRRQARAAEDEIGSLKVKLRQAERKK